jgi:predicted permease
VAAGGGPTSSRALRIPLVPLVLAMVGAARGGLLGLAFLLELLPALTLGWLLSQRWPQLAARLAPPLVRWGVPFSLAGLLLRGGLRWDTLEVMLLALLLVAGGLVLLHTPLARQWFATPPERLGAVVGNTAYFGIPAALTLLPPQALGYAVGYDLAATLFTWTLGPLLLAGRPLALRPVLRALAASPASQGLLGALLIQATPWQAPLAAWLWWPARAVVWLSLVVLGLRIGPLLGRWLPLRLWPTLVCKLLLFPLMALLLAVGLQLPPLLRGALVLQAAAPTAISVLLLSEAVSAPAAPAAAGAAATSAVATTSVATSDAAALVLWTTLLALLSVPLWAGGLQCFGFGA